MLDSWGGRMKLPTKTMSDTDLLRYVTKLQIPNFRGVYMRDELTKPRKYECGILNLRPTCKRVHIGHVG